MNDELKHLLEAFAKCDIETQVAFALNLSDGDPMPVVPEDLQPLKLLNPRTKPPSLTNEKKESVYINDGNFQALMPRKEWEKLNGWDKQMKPAKC